MKLEAVNSSMNIEAVNSDMNIHPCIEDFPSEEVSARVQVLSCWRSYFELHHNLNLFFSSTV